MKFYDREEEMQKLSEVCGLSGFRLVVISGRRRVGKTRMVLEFLKDRDFEYVFVPMHKTKETFLQEIAGDRNIPEFKNVTDLFRYLIEKHQFLFVDEFQNFYDMDKSIYSDIQKLADEFRYKEKKCCMFISGSSHSLMNKVFTDPAHPLYGRADIMIELKALCLETVLNILSDLNIKDREDMLRYYAIFGGIPKYYDLLENRPGSSFEQNTKAFFFDANMPLLKEEGRNVLITEFAGEYRTYYSILEAIASGKNTMGEINSILGQKGNRSSRYLEIMRKQYNVVKRETPILDDPRRSRRGIYTIKDPFLHFWFTFIKRYEAYFEQERTEELFTLFKNNIDTFMGFSFERIVKEYLRNNPGLLPFKPHRIGRQWGTIKNAPKGRNTYDIDLLITDLTTDNIMLIECKWRTVTDTPDILRALHQKKEYLSLKEDCNIYYGICAKEIAPEKGLFVLGLKDIVDVEDQSTV